MTKMSAKTDFSRAKNCYQDNFTHQKTIEEPMVWRYKMKGGQKQLLWMGQKVKLSACTEKERNYTIIILRFTKKDLMKAATDLQMLFN